HTLALTPGRAMDLSRARLFFDAGSEMEASLATRLQGPRIVHVELGEPMDDLEDTGHHHDGHPWLNPRALVRYAEGVATALSAEDPANADAYEANYRAFAAQVGSAVAQARSVLDPYAGRRFYVQHDAFGGFAEFFGLEQVAIESHGREAGARDL